MARLKKYASVKPEDGSSRLNANEEKKVAWMPFQGQKKEKKKENKGEAGSVGLYMLKRKYTNYRVGGGDKSFEEWRKGK